MEDETISVFNDKASSTEEKYQYVINHVIAKEPKMNPQVIEFLTRLDMQYSGLNPLTTLLTDDELARLVHLDAISTKKVNMMTLRAQAEFYIHIVENQNEISDWLNCEMERQLKLFLSDVVSEDERIRKRLFYPTLAEIFLHIYTLENYVLEEVRAAFETLMPAEDIKKFFYLDIKDQIETVKALFHRTLGCIMLFNPEGRLASELTGMYLAVFDMQVLLTAELENDLVDSKAYVELVQNMLEQHQLTGAFDFVYAESHALLALHLQLEQFYLKMLRQILASKARLEILEFRVDTLKMNLMLDRSHCATGDAPDSMITNFHDMGGAFYDIYCECLVLSNINSVFGKIKDICKQVFSSLHEETVTKIFEQYPKAPMTAFSSQEVIPVATDPPFLEALYDAPWQTYDPYEELALNGICVVSLLDKHSYIKKGDLDLGVCKWKGKYYALSSLEAMDKFGKNPHLFADIVHCVGHERPELIVLLGLQDQFPYLEPIKNLRLPVHMMTCSKTCWTRAERLPEKEEWADSWSEWDKPHILDTQYDTKNIGAQPSYNQRDKDTQCAPKVDSEMQTNSDVCLNTDNPTVRSPRLLSHVQVKPYWVPSLDLEVSETEGETETSILETILEEETFPFFLEEPTENEGELDRADFGGEEEQETYNSDYY